MPTVFTHPVVGLASRRGTSILLHAALWSMAFWAAFLLRFDFQIPDVYVPAMWLFLPITVATKVLAFGSVGLFRGLLRYTGTVDLYKIAASTFAASAVFAAVVLFSAPSALPRSVLVLDGLFALVAVAGARIAFRAVWEIARREGPVEREDILVIGAGNAAENLVREMHKGLRSRYRIVGLVDDDPLKHKSQIHGVSVLGAMKDLATFAQSAAVRSAVIAIPSATGTEMRMIVKHCQAAGLSVRTIPGLDELIDGRVSLNQIRDVEIEDLLGRDPIELDASRVSSFLSDRSVMVTGAGGSIGSELCRQIARFSPGNLILVERSENALFHAHREMVARFPAVVVTPVLADIRDSMRLSATMERFKPSVVFHAAAHKHVPMVEMNAPEAVLNNVFGTKNLAELCCKHGVETMVMISTDKAVNPTSVMGATKRVAEMVVHAMNSSSATRFVTVRFGNVLGSAGSVVPIFKEQIRKGGPVTVTHPEMVRFFMTIPEASQLVLQAGTMGEEGEIFILDMGEPVRILDLARDLIRLSGLTVGEDIDIEFMGVRPGEKLYEELTFGEEGAERTKHEKILVGRLGEVDEAAFDTQIRRLSEAALDARDPEAVRRALGALVPTFTGLKASDGDQEPVSSAEVVPLFAEGS